MSKPGIFTKTALGRTEMEARSGKLNPRQRRALIFIDGKITIDELRERLAADELSHTLGMLEEEDYVEVLGMREDTASEIAPAPERLPSITAFRPLPDVAATAAGAPALPVHPAHSAAVLRPAAVPLSPLANAPFRLDALRREAHNPRPNI